MRNRIFSTRIFAAVILFIPCVLQAAGLGKLTVHSGLGQPLRAEIELLSVTKEEAGSLAAKLASPEAFQQAGIPYSSELGAIKLAVENNSRGQPVIKLISAQPFNEPFLDLLVELNWSSGRLLREYTALLDPPDVGIPLSPPVAVAPEAIAEAKAPPLAKETAAPAPATTAADGEYGPVKSGDTLSKIALGVKPSDVNLEQALVSLYRANQDAFAGNMNRLKTGYILRVPDPVEFASVPKPEAGAEVKAQTADWNAYRQKLGIAPVSVAEGGSQRSASGKISVADSGETAAESGDVLKISKAETAFAPTAQASGALQEKIKTLEEEVVTKEQAVKEANERVAILEKQVSEMKRLVELQGQAPAPVESKPEAPAEPKAESAPAQPKTESAPSQPEKPVAVSAPKPPAESGSFLDEVMQNPLYLAALGLVVILAGFLGVKALRRKQVESNVVIEEPVIVAADEPQVQPAAAVTDTVITAGSAEEMDPLAEAEVYLAYDRETQAEEILKEGLRKTPARHELHMKLLEIYSRRRDFTSFDATAQQLYNATGGMGPTWERAATMGYQFNPSNPLYARDDPADLRPIQETRDESVFSAAPEEPTATVPEFEFDIGREESRPVLAAESDFKLDETLLLRNEDAPPVEEPELTPQKLIATIDFNVERKHHETRFETPVKTEEEKPVSDFMRQHEGPALSFDGPEVKNGNGRAGDLSFRSEPQPAFSDIDLNLEDQPSPASGGDELWQQVETKFDLARAYHEMG
ncbi:MAG: type IV pilus assembly protein FimV, partial [Burkholderiales bacterium]